MKGLFFLISLAAMVFGATAVYPCRGFDASLSLKAIHQERFADSFVFKTNKAAKVCLKPIGQTVALYTQKNGF